MKNTYLLIVNGGKEYLAFTTFDKLLGYLFSMPKNPLLRTLTPDLVQRKVKEYGKFRCTSDKWSIEVMKLVANPEPKFKAILR